MASLENFINIEKVYGPDLLNRFNLFQSIAVTGNPAEGYSSGQALAAIERVAAQTIIKASEVIRIGRRRAVAPAMAALTIDIPVRRRSGRTETKP